MTVTLTWYERCLAAQVGLWRHFCAVRDGRKLNHGIAPGDGNVLAKHVDGAMGEMALAKSLNVYWDASVDTFKSPDVGKIYVRTRSQPCYQMLIRDEDPDGEPFVLVRGSEGYYEIVGWIWSQDARQPQWRHGYGQREPAFFVPDEYLYPMTTLPTDRRQICR